MALLLAVLSIFVLALAAPAVHRLARAWSGAALATLPFLLTLYFIAQIPAVASGETFSAAYAWVPSLGVEFSFYLDGLALLFSLLICGIGALIVLYAGGYLAGHHQQGRFFAFLILFMGSMQGLVLADNLITLFVFWEMTSVSSFLLIGFDHSREASRKSAWQALLVTGLGGLALLAGLVLLGYIGQTTSVTGLLAGEIDVREHALYTPVLLLVLFGAFTKSAQFPFHFWLPNAMEAPTPVSAYLHSSTMVKAGVYLLARLNPVLGGTEQWQILVGGFGAVTMLVGAYLALRQNLLKRLLAYSTVSALGYLVMLLGVGTEMAVKAAAAFLLAHALYKGCLFLVAGTIDHETGEKNVERLGGLARAMPLTALGAGLAALSMAGIPPFFGFIGKELVLEASLESPLWPIALTACAGLASIAMVVVAALVAYRPFMGPRRETPRRPHEPGPGMLAGPLVLGALGLLAGLIPGALARPIVEPTTRAILASPDATTKLVLWHGLTPALGISALAVLLGAAVYALRGPLLRSTAGLETLNAIGPERWYDLAFNGLVKTAELQTRLFQSGYLRYYLLITVGTAIGLLAYVLGTRDVPVGAVSLEGVTFYELGLAALILGAAVTAVRSKSSLTAVAAVGVLGYGVALIYVIFGAPDLAMTQIAIETLSVILFVLVFYHLPPFRSLTSPIVRYRDVAVALTLGAIMGLLVLVAGGIESVEPISGYFAQQAVPGAKGHNVVNVILVDFRAMDTLGELVVVALAGVGVFALLKLRPREGGEL